MDPNDRTLTLTMIMEPQHANAFGNVHGGEILRFMDTTAGCAAIRYAKTVCVTARADEMQFMKPIHIGDYVTCTGTVVYTGNTSVEVRVTVDAESILADRGKRRALEAFFTYVALDKNGNPTPVPPFTPETEREKELFEHVKQRREFDRKRREAAKSKSE